MWRSPRRRAGIWLGIALNGVVLAARAADPSGSEAGRSVDHADLVPRIRMPEPLELHVDYPPGASGEGVVMLELVVDVDGRVPSARAVEGVEPFASAAELAALGFSFIPAQRDGRPTAAKVHVQIVFRPPPADAASAPPAVAPSPLSPPAVAPSGPTGQPAGPAPVARDDGGSLAAPSADGAGQVVVTVVSEPQPADAESLTRSEARMIPGTFGDPLRAIEVMPGVAPAVAGLPYFFVRGAPPGNVGYFIDGVRVPMLWHAFVGPSVLNPATIRKVTLHRGGYPARYGRYAGAIVTADTIVPHGDYSGEASLRVVDAGIMQTIPLSPSGTSAMLVSGRYAYLGPVVTAMVSDVELGYWDYQVSSQYELGAHDRIGFLALGASDHFANENYDSSVLFHRLDPRYEHDFSDDSHLRLAVALGIDRTGSDKGFVRDTLIAPRAELHHRFGERLAVRTGIDYSFDNYRLEVGPGLRYRMVQALQGLGATRKEQTFGSYVDFTWRPWDHVWLSPGLRADVFHSEGQTEYGVDPRIAARLEVSDRVAFEHTLGLAHQSASFVPSVPGASVTNIESGLQRSVQASSSVEFKLPERSFLSVTAFDAIFTNLADPLGTEHQFTLDLDQLARRVRGNAYGLELFFKRPLTRRIGAMVAYTLSRSTRTYGKISTLSALDRTHVLTATVVADVGCDWQLGARSNLLSGVPTRRATTAGLTFDGSERTTPFFRIDLRAEKRYRLGPETSLSVVAELLNATFSREITERSCNDEGCTEAGVGPVVVPNVGAELRY